MKTKSIILFGLATAIVTSALVFDGVSHRRTTNRSQAIVQNPAASASTLPNSSIPAVEVPPAEDQSVAAPQPYVNDRLRTRPGTGRRRPGTI